MKTKIISSDFSALSLLNTEDGLIGLARKWTFVSNPPSQFKKRIIQNYILHLSNSLNITDVEYIKELDGVEDCAFFENMIVGGRYDKDFNKEVYLFSYPEFSELGKVDIQYSSPDFGDKNLSFFTMNGKTYVLYSINPMVMLEYNSLKAVPVLSNPVIPQIPEVHGGVSLIPYNKVELLGLCHVYTSIGNIRDYSIYAYTFLRYDPFKINRFSTPILTQKDIPEGLECPPDCLWLDPKNSKVVFERGLVDNGRILIGFGMQDSIIAVASLTKNEVEKKLKPVSQE